MNHLFNSLTVETRNICTRKCWFCKFGQTRQDLEKSVMSWPLIEKLVHNLADLDYQGRLSWYWTNEPLLDKRIYSILSFSRQHCPKAFLGLVTNGDLLDEHVYRRLRECGLDGLGVSAYDDATLDKVTDLGHDGRLVTLDMRFPEGRIENRAGNIKTNEELFESQRNNHRDRSCARPSTMMVVNPKGQVALCCCDMYTDVVMGDLHENRLEEIWFNERFEHYRQTLANQGRSALPLCRDCSYCGAPAVPHYPLPADPRPVNDPWESSADGCEFGFQQPPIGAGWHAAEWDRATWFRWTGPAKDSWLDVRWHGAGPCVLNCQILHTISTRALAGLQVRVNGHLVPLRQSFQGGFVEVEGPVPEEAWRSQGDYQRISFQVSEVLRPCDVESTSTDTRQLGLAISRIRLTPLNASATAGATWQERISRWLRPPGRGAA